MSIKKTAGKMSFGRILGLIVLVFVLAAAVLGKWNNFRVAGVSTGFDEYGYNYTARIFQGSLDGADRNFDESYWGDPTYSKDRLVMKWSKGWNDARFGGQAWGPDAWIDNEFNGKVPGGSGEVWHYKIVWVGTELEKSRYWRPGGYPIWGQFEVIFSQGTVANEHFWEVHASPAGYGIFK